MEKVSRNQLISSVIDEFKKTWRGIANVLRSNDEIPQTQRDVSSLLNNYLRDCVLTGSHDLRTVPADVIH